MLRLKNVGKCRIMFEDKNNNNIIMKSGEIKNLDIDTNHNFIKEGLLAQPLEVQAEISSSKILGLEEQVLHLKDNLKEKDDEIKTLKKQVKSLEKKLKETKKTSQNSKEDNIAKLKEKADLAKKEKEAE